MLILLDIYLPGTVGRVLHAYHTEPFKRKKNLSLNLAIVPILQKRKALQKLTDLPKIKKLVNK